MLPILLASPAKFGPNGIGSLGYGDLTPYEEAWLTNWCGQQKLSKRVDTLVVIKTLRLKVHLYLNP
jgi:hypothetical protein